MARDLWNSKELAWQLFRRDVSQRYRQSVLGILWVLVPPLVTTGIFVFLNSHKILNIEPTDIPYPVYVMLGTLLWQIFSESVLAPLQAFNACVPIMTKINMPREAPILAGMGQVLFYASVQFLPALGIMIWSGVPLGPAILLAPLAILILMIQGMAVGLFLVPVGGLFRDINEGASLALKLAFFLTPIVYPPPKEWPWSLLVSLNPVAPILQGARDILTKGTLNDPITFWLISGGSLVALLLALIFYRLAIPVVLERMGA